MNAYPIRPRPFPLFVIAVIVLLAHAALLAWLVFTPAAPPSQPEQRCSWVMLEPAKPQPRPPMPVPTAAPAPVAKPLRPAPVRQKAATTAPPIAAQKLAQAKLQPPAPHADAAPVTPPQAAQIPPSTPAHTLAPSQTTASRHDTAPGPAPMVGASAPPAAVPPVETLASYQADYLDNPPPPYPRLSRELGEEGTALLKVQVGPDGRALQVKLISSTGYTRLDEAAETTVAQWRFIPATRNGQAVTSWVLVPIRFRILD